MQNTTPKGGMRGNRRVVVRRALFFLKTLQRTRSTSGRGLARLREDGGLRAGRRSGLSIDAYLASRRRKGHPLFVYSEPFGSRTHARACTPLRLFVDHCRRSWKPSSNFVLYFAKFLPFYILFYRFFMIFSAPVKFCV